jgi:hypothetical protein
MKNGFRALLVYGFALTAMAYAVWQGDISILPVASAEWTNGCCQASSDCRGNFVCYSKPAGWEDCAVIKHFDPDCSCLVVDAVLSNYCNPPGQPPGGEGQPRDGVPLD